MLPIIYLALLSGVTIVYGRPEYQKRYDGHKVLQVHPKTQEEINNILRLGETFNLDIWKFPKFLNTTMDIHVTPEEFENFLHSLESVGSEAKIMIEDLQKLIDAERNSTGHRQTRATRLIDLTNYHSYSTISAYLDAVASASSHAQVINLGQTVEGRNQKLIKISNGQTTPGKKAIFMDAGIHAREWISTATILYMIDQLVFNPSRDSQMTTLLSKFDWYLLPMVNPDGYEYSRLHERLWRKNRAASDRISFFGSCQGVDLNRNFDFHWSPDIGGSRDPCQEIFTGRHASSEPEVTQLARFLDSHGQNIIAYMNFHSYGEFWLYPWGYTTTLPTDWKDLVTDLLVTNNCKITSGNMSWTITERGRFAITGMIEDHMARVATSAIYGAHHARYTVGEDARVLYAAAGGADDYAKGHAGIKYSYTVELRPSDSSSHGFVLPASHIVPSGQETWRGVKAFALGLIQRENL